MECGATVDAMGDHIVCCRRNRLWERHLGIQQFISRCLLARGLPHTLEKVLSQNSDLRSDITLHHWDNGVDMEVDVAVCHTAPCSEDLVGPEDAGRILEARAARKVSKYQDVCRSSGRTFTPFVVSTWGRLEVSAMSLWRDLVRKCVGHLAGPSRSARMSELHQGLSLALMRGVARQLQSLPLCLEGTEAGLVSPSRPSVVSVVARRKAWGTTHQGSC